MNGCFKLEDKDRPHFLNGRHQLSNNVALHLSRKENNFDNALNKLLIDCDNDLHKINDSSNVNGNLPVQECAAVM